jgi:fatty-acyl-CoA synthase
VFAGYVKGSDSRRWLDKSSIVDGWLRTGDLGSVDSEDRVWITGRSKDLIIRGGHNIDPTIIEEALLLHPHVRAAAAIGRPDLRAGEVPIAFVVVDSDYDGDDLVEWAARQIDEPAARPVTVELLPELPLTAVGKTFKPALYARSVADLIRARIEEIGATVEARVTDHGLQFEVNGSDVVVGTARATLKELAIDAEVTHHVR